MSGGRRKRLLSGWLLLNFMSGKWSWVKVKMFLLLLIFCSYWQANFELVRFNITRYCNNWRENTEKAQVSPGELLVETQAVDFCCMLDFQRFVCPSPPPPPPPATPSPSVCRGVFREKERAHFPHQRLVIDPYPENPNLSSGLQFSYQNITTRVLCFSSNCPRQRYFVLYQENNVPQCGAPGWSRGW